MRQVIPDDLAVAMPQVKCTPKLFPRMSEFTPGGTLDIVYAIEPLEVIGWTRRHVLIVKPVLYIFIGHMVQSKSSEKRSAKHSFSGPMNSLKVRAEA